MCVKLRRQTAHIRLARLETHSLCMSLCITYWSTFATMTVVLGVSPTPSEVLCLWVVPKSEHGKPRASMEFIQSTPWSLLCQEASVMAQVEKVHNSR